MESKLSHDEMAAQDRILSPIIKNIVAAFAPVEVWLFGSRYRGDAKATSDWDLLVLVDDSAPDDVFDPYLAWEIARDCDIPADIVVETISDFYQSVTVATSLAREIENERRILFKRP